MEGKSKYSGNYAHFKRFQMKIISTQHGKMEYHYHHCRRRRSCRQILRINFCISYIEVGGGGTTSTVKKHDLTEVKFWHY